MVGGSRRPVGGVGRNPWAAPDPARGQWHPQYKSEECSPWCRSLPLSAPRRRPLFSFLPISSQFSLVWDRKVNREPGGADGVQLRRHRGGGGQVPRPRPPPPPPQHDADRRGGVAQDDAEELVVRLVRPQPQPQPRPRPRPRRRAQVRVCAGHARRLLQVPPPPQQQLPRPPGVPSLPSYHLRRAAAGRGPVLLPHRRGAVTAPRLCQPRNAGPAVKR